ncbi:PREDICTED: nicotinamide N-methyltransferase-like, partial [Nanorana parkeri]|uniref:nicotinamide N-methyltransferase-like n=1 Tax=Nanorana parkeri TaxID=125878 RepID=UPI0008544762
GQIAGKLLIDISMGSLIPHLYSACNVFKDMVVLKLNEQCIMELSRWLHDLTGAYDWGYTSAAVAELEGTKDQLQDQELQLKSCIKQILKCDFERENISSPVALPLADCIVSALILDAISKDKDEYMRNLEKMIKLLRPGGKLILMGLLDATYIVVGGKRFHRLKYDEDFVKNALGKLGLVIDYCAVQKRRNMSDLIDYRSAVFVVARKGE